MEFCRLCLTATNLKINLKSLDNHTILFKDKLKMICEIKINEIFPTAICNLCEFKVQQFFQFKQMCLQSNLLLNKHKDELNKLFIHKLRRKILSDYSIDSKQKNIDETNNRINETNDGFGFNSDEFLQQNELEEISTIEDKNTKIRIDTKSSQLYSHTDTTNIENTKISPKLLKNKFKTVKKLKRVKIKLVDQNKSTGDKNASSKLKSESTSIHCHICDLMLENSKEFGHHINIHIHPNADGNFQCGKCEKIFGSKLSLRRHIKAFVKDCPYKCDQCDKIYHFRASYINHMKKHEPNQICAKCGLSFPTVTLLKRHELTHSPDKPYKCQICSQELKHKSTYNTHMKRHEMTPEERNARKFSCELCGKTYRSLDNLNIHKISHTTEKTHECTLCGKRFKYNRSLKNHVQIIHFGKRTICTICGKKCVSENVLKRHMRLHTGEQPYKCHLCPRAFCDQTGYYGHVLTHSNMRTQVCKYCGMQFKQRNYLYHHIKKKHPDAKKDKIDSNEIRAEKYIMAE